MNKIPADIDLDNREFQNALRLITDTNQSVFLTGKAGTGKSTFLKYICQATRKKFIVLAPTGIAAVNVGGMTMHSFFKMPLKPLIPDDPDYSPRQIRKTLRYPKEKVKIIKELDKRHPFYRHARHRRDFYGTCRHDRLYGPRSPHLQREYARTLRRKTAPFRGRHLPARTGCNARYARHSPPLLSRLFLLQCPSFQRNKACAYRVAENIPTDRQQIHLSARQNSHQSGC